MGRHVLLQGIFPTQGSHPGLLCCRQGLLHSRQTVYRLSYKGRWVIRGLCFQFPEELPSVRVSTVANQLAFPPTEKEGSLFSTPSPASVTCRFLKPGHYDQCGMVPPCDFDLNFSDSTSYLNSLRELCTAGESHLP